MRMNQTGRDMVQALGSVRIIPDFIPMAGGLDEVTAPLQRSPGTCRTTQNFEATLSADKRKPGGYRRIPGYERYDGRLKPSNANYAVLNADITGSVSVGQTLNGAGGATGVIIALPVSNDQFVLTKVVGVFVDAENLNVGGPTIATAVGSQIVDGADTAQLNAVYKNLAADEYRNDILAVPGSGRVRGVWILNDIVYAFRNNVANTACDMYKSSAGGWVQVVFEKEIAYTAGNGSVDDGDVLTQGGVTATVRRVLVRTGSLAGGTAVGTLVISTPAGGDFGAGAATTTGGGTLTLSGIQTAITLLPDGRFEFVNENFLGSDTTKRMYGCDGVNRAFEFDGNYFVPIRTGMVLDAPSHIWAHKKHLFLSFMGSAQHSGIGAPYAWSVVLGASELGMGDTITGFASQPGSETSAALLIFTRNRLSVLYGSSSANWNLVPYRDEIGAYPHTIQDAGITLFLDDRGVTNVATTQAYGNFAHATVSDAVRKFINQVRSIAISSCVSRDRSQYRLFFSNRNALYITIIGSKVVGIMPMLFDDTVRCVCSLELNDGNEVMFFGTDDGFVHQLDRGTSFDGDPIDSYFELAYNFQKTPRVFKRYRDAFIEVEGQGYAEFNFGYSLGYGSVDIPQPGTETIVVDFSPVFWDSFIWDQFFWDGKILAPSVLGMDGEAENVSLAIRSNNDYFEPFTITGAVVQYTPRRRLRIG